LRTPEETRVPAIGRAAEAAWPLYRRVTAHTPHLREVVVDAWRLGRHLALTDEVPPQASGEVDAVEAAAEKKIRDAQGLEQAIASLTPEERARVQALPALLVLLARLPPG